MWEVREGRKMMNRLGFVIAVAILALATVTVMAASPNGRDPATGSPTLVLAQRTPTPIIVKGSPTLSVATASPTPVMAALTPTPMMAAATISPTVVINVQPCEGSEDAEAMEEVRRELLTVADVLDGLYPYAQAYAQSIGDEPAPRVNRQQIEEATHEELCWTRQAFGDEYESFLDSVKALSSLVLIPGNESSQDVQGLGASPDSFGIIPSPTPVTTPPPGILHNKDHIAQVNQELGDLPDPDYPTAVGCPSQRYPAPATFAVLLTSFVTKEIDHFAEAAECEGTFFVVAIPFGGGTNLPGCLGWAILKGINLATEFVKEGLEFCEGNIDFAEIAAAEANTEIIHAELAMHDRNLNTRFNTVDNFLFNFRNLNLETRIEANLASPSDDPIALFILPRTICISPDLENLTDPNSADYNPFAPEVIAGCGLLEVVSDTVRSAIDMTTIASGPQSVNNAETEFAAAVQHYNNREWKLAYDRFRKAYREVTRPSP
jgi:hypothetical protein